MTPSPSGRCVVGIDVAKDTIEIAVINSDRVDMRRTLENHSNGFKELIRIVRAYEQVHLVMEATGNYHQRLLAALSQARLTTSVVNPLQIKRYAQMKLSRVKTDRYDALLIAHYGLEQRPSAYVPASGAAQQLKQINTLIKQLVKQRTALKNMAHAQRFIPDAPGVCREVLEAQLAQIEQSLERLEAQRKKLVSDHFAASYERIKSITGIGETTAAALVAYMGDLSRFTRHKQLSAFVGINPVPNDSGTRHGQAHISKQGNKSLRTLLYMCAQSAARHNRTCRALYERLLQKGKKKKVALIAVANKLLKQVFVVVKRGVLFDNFYHDKNAFVA